MGYRPMRSARHDLRQKETRRFLTIRTARNPTNDAAKIASTVPLRRPSPIQYRPRPAAEAKALITANTREAIRKIRRKAYGQAALRLLRKANAAAHSAGSFLSAGPTDSRSLHNSKARLPAHNAKIPTTSHIVGLSARTTTIYPPIRANASCRPIFLKYITRSMPPFFHFPSL